MVADVDVERALPLAQAIDADLRERRDGPEAEPGFVAA